MGKIITSFAATGRENYPKAQLRLIHSVSNVKAEHNIADGALRQHHLCLDGYCDQYAGEYIHLGRWPTTEMYGTAWQHADAPYQFKPYLMQECLEMGHMQIIWCDSTIVMVDNPERVFAHAKEHGVCAVDNWGFPLMHWISDAALKTTGLWRLSDTELGKVKQIMGCMVAFDLTNPRGAEIFKMWLLLSRDGVSFQDGPGTRPGFRAHRHDQAILSALLHRYNVPILPYGVLCYAERLHLHQEAIFVNKGL